MPFYHKLGEVPHKRHTQFRKPDGSLYREEVMGLEGFSGLESILYHYFLPPRVESVEDLGPADSKYVDYGPLRHRAFRTIDFQPGDYMVIPYGTTWQMNLNEDEARFFVIEAPSQIEPPTRYRNRYGQLLEHAPYHERDIRVPEELETHTERGQFEVRVKARNRITRHTLDHHPFDVVGWDGYLYPWIFSIHDFEPITGLVHQPPPVHQTFQGNNFVVCSFVPRLFDYHPEGIPAPYNHSNVNSDEVIYYSEGNFMSRKGIDQYDITLHPSGLPHGPQPGATEASIGKERTDELAVMVDTFNPLQVAMAALELEKPEYMASWLEGSGE
jgi:homogentisate 1,2-dioxygenase